MRGVASDGSKVCALGSAIFIDGRLSATRKEVDRQGRPLPWWHGCERLREGQLFLLMDHRDSFDGRYFGPVDETSVIGRSEEHTSELQSLMRISYAVFCLKKKN